MTNRIDPIDAAAVRSAVAPPFAAVDVVSSTGSTNADLRAAAEAGAADYTVLIAEEQTAGVGRLGRTWVSPAGGLYLSVLLRPSGVPGQQLGSLAVVAGLALAAVATSTGVPVKLKWPNDVLTPSGKLAGVLSELVPSPEPTVVLGIGLNVHPLGDVPPGPGDLAATSLADSGAQDVDRATVAVALLRAFAEREQAWRSAGGDLAAAGLLDAYRAACVTVGSKVRVSMPDDQYVDGVGADVDAAGQLVLETSGGARTTVFAGDVVHVR